MDFISSDLASYIEQHTSKESELLHQLNRETHLKVLIPRMLSGHLQGRVLSMFSHMIKPKNILEIGTYTGYSAICLSEGLAVGGVIDTVDINEELTPIITKYWEKAGIIDSVQLHLGNALDIIPRLNKAYDLVFIDADKENYSAYYDLVFKKMPVGGIILADNVLWSGNVLQEPNEMTESTKAIVDFNTKVQNDSRVENVLMPIRDGLMVLRKISD
ncbi:MAG: O-methyltransferase [Putridiphycobacter sp.]|nr:O-methyltransferase [Putridiphycobacter sp.]